MHEHGKLDAAADRETREAQEATGGKPPREDDPATAQPSTEQKVIQRQGADLDDDVARLAGKRPVPREPDPASPGTDPTQTPIQRPDPDSGPIVRQRPGAERGEE